MSDLTEKTFMASTTIGWPKNFNNILAWYYKPTESEVPAIEAAGGLKSSAGRALLRPRERVFYAYRNFPHMPPQYRFGPKWPRPQKPPYKGAPDWQCSVYFYWWAFLRENQAYRQYCDSKRKSNGGKNNERYDSIPKLFRDFGDVYIINFENWWFTHYGLFTDCGGMQEFDDEKQYDQNGNYRPPEPGWRPRTLDVALPVAYSKKALVRSAKDQIDQRYGEVFDEHLRGAIRYEVAQRPVLSALHDAWMVWRVRKANPDIALEMVADVAGLDVAVDGDVTDAKIQEMKAQSIPVRDLERAMRRAKQKVVSRQLRMAEQYIENVGQGRFPVRDKR